MPTNVPPSQLPGVTLISPTTNGFVSATSLEITKTGDTSIESNCNIYVAFPVKFLAGQVKKALSFQSSGDIGAVGVGSFYSFVADNLNSNAGYQFSSVSTIGTQVASISSPTAVEGNPLVFTVSLASVTSAALSVPLLVGGNATSGVDYLAFPTVSNGVVLSNGMLNIPIGVSSFTITYPTLLDYITEGNETLVISIAGIVGTGTIQDSTAPAPSTISSVSSVSGNEGTTLVHTVVLSGATGGVFSFALTDVTTSVNLDYTFPPVFSNGVTLSGNTITVPNGVTTFTVSVAALADLLVESTETYNLTIGGVSGVGTIYNVAAPSSTTWDAGASVWDAGASIWDRAITGILWDGGTTTWDGGTTVWAS